MSRFIKLLSIMTFIAGTTVAVSACNTIEGIGKDAQAAGQAISGSAEKTRSY
jgi:predicted small secreted protein|tara:strand:- start:94 stop:249 length:156 start_codon:yes stop_codon:yes gene_type:complete